MRPGSPATGVGTTNAGISSGSAACGACRRPVISGCPATGRTRRGRGIQRISGYWMPAQLQETTYLPQPPQSMDIGPTSNRSGPELLLGRGPLAVAWRPLCLAARLLDSIPARLDLGAGDLCLESARLGLRAGLLGLSFGPSRPGLFAGVLCRSGGRLPAGDLSGCGRVQRLAFLPPDLWPLLLWRLLRRSLRGVRHSALFLLQFGSGWLRSAVRLLPLVSRRSHGRTRLGPAPGWLARLLSRSIRRCVRHTPGPSKRGCWRSREGMGRPDIAQLRMVGDVHVVARLPGASVRLQVVSPMERAHIQEAARASVRSEAERRQVERQVGGAGRGAEKVSLSSMPTYKAAAAARSAAAPTGRPVGNYAAPARGAPARRAFPHAARLVTRRGELLRMGKQIRAIARRNRRPRLRQRRPPLRRQLRRSRRMTSLVERSNVRPLRRWLLPVLLFRRLSRNPRSGPSCGRRRGALRRRRRGPRRRPAIRSRRRTAIPAAVTIAVRRSGSGTAIRIPDKAGERIP